MAFWIPAIGGALGAIEGYRRGGIGGAITGGALGAVVPKGLRMAGVALGGTKLGAGIASGIGKGRNLIGLQGPAASGSTVLGGLLPAVGLGLNVPGVVGGAAGGAVGGKGVANQYPGSSTGPVSGVYDYLSPISSRNLQLGWTQKELDQQRQAVVDQAIALRPIMEAAKEEELRRNMAAQQLGRIGADKVLGALAANYQYQ